MASSFATVLLAVRTPRRCNFHTARPNVSGGKRPFGRCADAVRRTLCCRTAGWRRQERQSCYLSKPPRPWLVGRRAKKRTSPPHSHPLPLSWGERVGVRGAGSPLVCWGLVSSAAIGTAAAAATVAAAPTPAAPAAATAATATTAVLTRPGLVDGQRAALVVRAVECFDGALGLAIVGHLDEAEATRPAGFPVGDDLCARDRAIRLKECKQIVGGAIP